jgi:hypothetical protein
MTLAVKERFCPYCRCFKTDEGFKVVLHPATGSKRMQCTPCQETRKRPRAELVKLAADEGEAKRKAISEATKRGIEQRKKRENTCDQ